MRSAVRQFGVILIAFAALSLAAPGVLAASFGAGLPAHVALGSASLEGRVGVQFVAVPQWSTNVSPGLLQCDDVVVMARLGSGRQFSSRAFGDINSGSCEYRLNVSVPVGTGEQALMDWSVPSDKGKAIKSSPIVVEIVAGQVQRADFGALVGLCAHPNRM